MGFIQKPCDLIQVTSDLSILRSHPADSGKQLITGCGYLYDRMDNCTGNGLADHFSLTHSIGLAAFGKGFVFFIGQHRFDEMVAVRGIIFFRDKASPPIRKNETAMFDRNKKSPYPATAAGFGEGTPQQVSDRGQMSVIRNLVPWSILALNK